jgi:hypothetical protein
MRILDIFQQAADDGIPSHYCVQYMEGDDVFVSYMYFASLTDAREFAGKHGYED